MGRPATAVCISVPDRRCRCENQLPRPRPGCASAASVGSSCRGPKDAAQGGKIRRRAATQVKLQLRTLRVLQLHNALEGGARTSRLKFDKSRARWTVHRWRRLRLQTLLQAVVIQTKQTRRLVKPMLVGQTRRLGPQNFRNSPTPAVILTPLVQLLPNPRCITTNHTCRS